MKRAVALAILAVLALSMAGIGQTKTLNLEYKLKKGDVDKYKLVVNMKFSSPEMPSMPQGDMNMKMTATVTQKVLDVLADGSAKVKMSVTDLKMSMPGMPQGAALGSAPKSMAFTVTMSKDGKITGMEGLGAKMMPGGIPGMDFGQLMGQGNPTFPGKPVAVGETWSQEVPFPMGGGKLKVTSTLLAADVPVGKESAAKIKQVVSGHIDLGEMTKGLSASANAAAKPENMPQLSGGMDLAGWSVVYFSVASGRMIKTNANMTANMNFALPAEVIQEGGPVLEAVSEVNMVMDLTMFMSRVR